MKPISLLLVLLSLTVSLRAQIFLTPQVDSIPMRDGAVLAADVYRPVGTLARPTILIQTPYNRLAFRFGLPLGIGLALDSIPYNLVILDWRGFYGSIGALAPGANRGEDGYDAVEWIATQPWSDGQVATWGPSALGQIQFLTAREQPPHLVCICPVVAEPWYFYEEYYPGGVYRTEYIEQLDGLGFGLSGILQANPIYNLFWAFAEQETWYPGEINVPTFMIGGWYDHNIEPSLRFFDALQFDSPPPVQDAHRLLVGPWAHGGFGVARPGGVNQGELSFPAAAGWNDSLARAFFDHYLLDSANGWDASPPITYFLPGENSWQETDFWPPVRPLARWYLQGDGSLAPTLPTTPDSLSWLSDPHDPS
ncbi:MAG: CocE/NonD family hydrolase, partial [Bacteroidetes bacterium]